MFGFPLVGYFESQILEEPKRGWEDHIFQVEPFLYSDDKLSIVALHICGWHIFERESCYVILTFVMLICGYPTCYVKFMVTILVMLC